MMPHPHQIRGAEWTYTKMGSPIQEDEQNYQKIANAPGREPETKNLEEAETTDAYEKMESREFSS